MSEISLTDLASVDAAGFRHRVPRRALAPAHRASPAVRLPRLPRRKPFVGSPEWFFDVLGTIDAGALLDRPQRTALAIALPPTLGLAAAYGGTVGGVDLAFPHRADIAVQAPDRVGDLTRVPHSSDAIAHRLESAENTFQLQFMGNLGQIAHAVYRPDHLRGGPVTFMGATLLRSGDPDRFARNVEASILPEGYQVVPVDAGAGARGVCLVAPSRSHASAHWCAWATEHTVGEIGVVRTGWTADRLAAQMRIIRAATETGTTP